MNPTLRALAQYYRQSAAGRGGAVKDYTLGWERFLRLTGLDDGDARELAEQELVEAERASEGLLQIDRNHRTGAKEGLRLKHSGGEAWLFSATGASSPVEERQLLAVFFQESSATEISSPYAAAWCDWLSRLAVRARDGSPVSPFKRDDQAGNARLLRALSGVLNWQDESLIRYASTVLLGDSKLLEALRPRLLSGLREITGREEVTLEDFGIADAPRSVWLHGPLLLHLSYGEIDFGVLSGPVAVSATDLAAAGRVDCAAPLCLTVENHTVFRELVKARLGILLVQTSFPGAATRLLFERLPSGLPCFHFGDSDPAGYEILRDLREKTGRAIAPFLMPFRFDPDAPRLTDGEKKDLARLLSSPVLSDVHPELQAMLNAGTKGLYEQESCPVPWVVDGIRALITAQTSEGNGEQEEG